MSINVPIPFTSFALRARFYSTRTTWRTPVQRAYYLQLGTRRGPFGYGAGYIGGATLFFALNAINPAVDLYRTVRVQFGATRGGNRVPYCQG